MSKQPLPNEQLASLLIDGELTGENLALANQRLQDDAEFAAEVNMLRQQRELFKQLPAFETPSEFPDRVLESSINQIRAIVGDANFGGSQTVATKASARVHSNKNGKHEFTTRSAEFERKINATYTLRTAIAAVASLAGMILLTLFVFPQGTPNSNNDLALVMEKGGAVSDESFEAQTVVVPQGTARSKGDFDDGLKDSLTKAQADSSELVVEAGNQERRRSKNSAAKGSVAKGSVAKGDVDLTTVEALVSNNAIQETSNSAGFPAGAKIMPDGFSGTPMEKRSENLANPGQAGLQIAGSQPAVEQIWYVDLDDPNETLGAIVSVGDILRTNRIEVQYDQANRMNEMLAKQSIADQDAAFKLDQRAMHSQQSILKSVNETGFEAFYVNATPGQMKQALIELSNKADISTLPIALNAGQTQSLAAGSTLDVQQRAANQPSQQVAVPPTLVMQNDRAMAQQLINVPLLRGSRQQSVSPVPPIPNSNDPALDRLVMREAGVELQNESVPSIEGAPEPAAESKAFDVAESDETALAAAVPQAAGQKAMPSAAKAQVGKAQAGGNQIGQAEVDAKNAYFDSWIAEPESEQQLRQYLILVRTPKPGVVEVDAEADLDQAK